MTATDITVIKTSEVIRSDFTVNRAFRTEVNVQHLQYTVLCICSAFTLTRPKLLNLPNCYSGVLDRVKEPHCISLTGTQK